MTVRDMAEYDDKLYRDIGDILSDLNANIHYGLENNNSEKEIVETFLEDLERLRMIYKSVIKQA